MLEHSLILTGAAQERLIDGFENLLAFVAIEEVVAHLVFVVRRIHYRAK